MVPNWENTALTLPHQRPEQTRSGRQLNVVQNEKGSAWAASPDPLPCLCLWAAAPAPLAAGACAHLESLESAKGDPSTDSFMNCSNLPGKILLFLGMLESYLRRNHLDFSVTVKNFVRMETSLKSSLIHGILTYLSCIMLKSCGAGWHGKSRGS